MKVNVVDPLDLYQLLGFSHGDTVIMDVSPGHVLSLDLRLIGDVMKPFASRRRCKCKTEHYENMPI